MAGGTALSRTRSHTANQNNRLRIIGGRWRGRKLGFPDIEGLRPTPDRIRETLFNWLQNDIQGARCLDLFAGSGALGLEALSRGADKVVLCDSNAEVVKHLRDNLQRLQAEGGEVLQQPAQDYVSGPASKDSFDIVFLDPPFHQGLLEPCINLLENSDCLAGYAHIYVESESNLKALALPPNWELLKEKAAGQVTYRLLLRQNTELAQ